jgi:hypothetical protein
VILVIFVPLHNFAIPFSSPPPVFVRRRRCFDVIFGSNALLLLEVKTPPPCLPLFSCDSSHFPLSRCYCEHSQPPNPFDIIANIETRRSAVTDKRIAFFAAAFRIPPSRFFPARLTLNWPKDQ